MRCAKSLLAVISLLLTLSVMAKEQFYRGQIGAVPAIFSISIDQKNAVSGRYFLMDYRVDYSFSGQKNGHQLQLAIDTYLPAEKKRLQLTLSADQQQLHGTITDAAGKQQRIQLQAITLPPVKADENPYLAELRNKKTTDDDYEFLRLSNVPLKPIQQQTVQGYRLQWLQDPASKLKTFQLKSGYSPQLRAKINQQLQALLLQNLDWFYDCQSKRILIDDRDPPPQYEYEVILTPVYRADNVISIKLQQSDYCGGAHPNYSESSITYGIVNGEVRQLELADMLWIGGDYPLSAQFSGHQWQSKEYNQMQQYKEKVFAPWLFELFQQRYPKQMAERVADGCSTYEEAKYWTASRWYLTPQGIYLPPNISYWYVGECDDPDWAILPYSELSNYVGWFKPHYSAK